MSKRYIYFETEGVRGMLTPVVRSTNIFCDILGGAWAHVRTSSTSATRLPKTRPLISIPKRLLALSLELILSISCFYIKIFIKTTFSIRSLTYALYEAVGSIRNI